MPTPDIALKILVGQAIGAQELRLLQGLWNEQMQDLLAAQLVRPGPVVSFHGGVPDTVWRVHDDDTDAIISVTARSTTDQPQSASLITADGKLVRLDPLPDDELVIPFSDGADEVPNDGTWYSVVVRAVQVTHGRGTLTVTSGSAAVAGAGTTFTRFAVGSEYGAAPVTYPTQIVVTGTASNDGTYVVSTITDDDTLTMTTNFIANQTIPAENWYVKGRRLSTGYTDPGAIVQRLAPEFEVVARVVEPDPGDFVLADVKRDGGTLLVVDRRAGSCAMFASTQGPRQAGHWPVPKLTVDRVTPFTAVTLEQVAVDAGLADATSLACAPTSGGGVLVVGVESTSTDLNAYLSTRPFAFGTAVLIDTGVESAGICKLPAGLVATHLCVYTKAGVMYVSTSDDDGATWSAGAIHWDPTTVAALDTVNDPWPVVLQNGRVVVYGSYYSNAITRRSVRAIYSDDYLDTWETNGDQGSSIAASLSADLNRPSVAQDARGRVYLAYDQGATPDIRVKATWNGDGITWAGATSWAAIDPAGNVGNYRPVVLCGAVEGPLLLWFNGTVVVGPDERNLFAAVLTEEPDAPNADLLLQVDDAAPVVGSNGLGACYLNGGELVVLYESTGPAYPVATRFWNAALAGSLVHRP